MPNRNYVNGRAKEYRIMNVAKKEGKIALRSAGSHSPIDVVVINILEMKINLIQCKPKSMSQNKRNDIINENIKLNGLFKVNFVVV